MSVSFFTEQFSVHFNTGGYFVGMEPDIFSKHQHIFDDNSNQKHFRLPKYEIFILRCPYFFLEIDILSN